MGVKAEVGVFRDTKRTFANSRFSPIPGSCDRLLPGELATKPIGYQSAKSLIGAVTLHHRPGRTV